MFTMFYLSGSMSCSGTIARFHRSRWGRDASVWRTGRRWMQGGSHLGKRRITPACTRYHLSLEELQTLRLMTGRLQAGCLPSPEEGQGWSRWTL